MPSLPPSSHTARPARGYLRDPHLHGDLLTFVAENDVWIAPVSGGRAWRAGADPERARHPRLSPDGRRIAWTSWREGVPEAVVAPVEGGAPVQVTHWANARTRVLGWLSPQELLVVSAVGQRATRRTWARAVRIDGGLDRRLPYGPVAGVAHGPGGAVLIQTPSMFAEAAHWKRYRGGTTGRLWMDRRGDGAFTRVHEDVDGNIECPLWVGDRIAFLSDHEENGRLWSSLPDGSDLRCHTAHPFATRGAATDGARVVYHSGGELWLLAGLGAGVVPEPVDISLGSPAAARAAYVVTGGEGVEDFDTDRAGREAVVTVRGSVHRVGGPAEPTRELPREAGTRARLPRVLGDTGKVAYVVVVGGRELIEVSEEATAPGDKAASHRFGTGLLGRVRELVAAPDGGSLAVATHDGRVLVACVATGALTEVDRTDGAEATDVVFSPDSRWLAWSHPGANGLRQIRLADLADPATGKVVEATPLRFSDRSPAFTQDGLYLAFLSERGFEPVPQAHLLGPAFAAGTRLCLLPLAKDTPSPFSPHDPRRAVGNGEVIVDRDGLAERAELFPVPAGDFITLRAAEGGVLWIRKDPSSDWLAERGTLMRWDFNTARASELRPEVDEFAVSGDGRRVLARTGRTLTAVPADRPASADEATEIALETARTRITPRTEWAQAFEEDGQLIRDVYVRADMGGVDWDAVLDRYRPLVDRLGCYDDFVDLLWEVHGELGCSHAYVRERPTASGPRRHQGLLGADFTRDPDGTWRVARIPRGDASVDGALSPLSAPGVEVRAGDAILEIHGVPLRPTRGPAALLTGRAGMPTRLTVRGARDTAPRTVTVVPLKDETALRYSAWVAERRELVATASGGLLGYLHVPNMLGPGWAQLHRDLRTEFDRPGLVVDLRENTGGYLSELVVEALSRRVLGWRVTRGGSALSYPSLAPRGPVVVVTDEFTGSDGDVATAAVKALGIGPVVGNRTWGGVNVMDWNFSLADGTGLILPREAYWLTHQGWQVENQGISPDIEVSCTPEDWAQNRDPHLEAAVRAALTHLTAQPPATPPRPAW